MTKQQTLICDILANVHDHLTAEEVFFRAREHMPNIAMGTVYRNLALFKEQGLIMSLGTVNGVERFDANTQPHVHFICDGCDAVIDLHQLTAPQALCQEAEGSIGCTVYGCQLSFTGKCRDCLENQS